MSEKLPLEILREKYIPINECSVKYDIPVAKILKMLKENKINRGEFRAPGDSRRSLHVNYEEVLEVLRKEAES